MRIIQITPFRLFPVSTCRRPDTVNSNETIVRIQLTMYSRRLKSLPTMSRNELCFNQSACRINRDLFATPWVTVSFSAVYVPRTNFQFHALNNMNLVNVNQDMARLELRCVQLEQLDTVITIPYLLVLSRYKYCHYGIQFYSKRFFPLDTASVWQSLEFRNIVDSGTMTNKKLKL